MVAAVPDPILRGQVVDRLMDGRKLDEALRDTDVIDEHHRLKNLLVRGWCLYEALEYMAKHPAGSVATQDTDEPEFDALIEEIAEDAPGSSRRPWSPSDWRKPTRT